MSSARSYLDYWQTKENVLLQEESLLLIHSHFLWTKTKWKSLTKIVIFELKKNEGEIGNP